MKHREVNKLLVCHECDSVQQTPKLLPDGIACCGCCGARLLTNPKGGLDTPFALTLASLMLFIIANSYPLITLNIKGQIQSTTLTGASMAFLENGRPGLALIVWFTTVLGPALVITGTLYAVVAIRFGVRMPFVRVVLAGLSHLQPWGMMDVFMLGVLVALVKLAGMADVVFGVGLYAFVALLLFFSGAIASLEPTQLWDRLEAHP
jgi:paraquat-inducible protein A